MLLEAGKTYPLSLAWLSSAGALTTPPSGLTVSEGMTGASFIDNAVGQAGWTATTAPGGSFGSIANGSSLTEATFTAGDSETSGVITLVALCDGDDGNSEKPEILVCLQVQIVDSVTKSAAIVIGPAIE